MKTRFLLPLLCFVSASLLAQVQPDTVSIGTKADGTELRAIAYSLPQRAETFSMSEEGDYLCVSFRETTKSGKYLQNKGEIGFYDLNRQELLWKSPINYLSTATRCLSQGVLINRNGKVWLLNKEDGTKRWETKLHPIYIDNSLGLMLGYQSATSNKLCAIDLNSGNELWQTKMPHQYGWSRIEELADGRRLIVADELHRLNFRTGEMETFPGSPGAYDTKAAILQGLAAVAMGTMGAAVSGGNMYYAYVPVANNTITSLSSNILQHEGRYYWADREQIACIDSTMNLVWKREFPDVKAGRSILFVQDDKLYMLSYGYGLRANGSRKKYGRPFIACYDLQEGTEHFFNKLSMKKDIVEDALHTKDALYMLFDDGLAYQELTDSVVNITPWDTDRNGHLYAMRPDTLYAANNDCTAFTPLYFDGQYCPVYNDKGTLYEIDKELNISRTYHLSEVYPISLRLRDYLCIGLNGNYHFIHRIGMPVARMPLSLRKGEAIGNKLLMLTQENRLLFLDMNEAVR